LGLAEKSLAETGSEIYNFALARMKNESENSDDLMKHRRIILKDGRYMIFYTFDESLSNKSASEEKPEPAPKLEATEEKNV
jgi:predicted lipoprotein with Yx(FWY)xxD motif